MIINHWKSKKISTVDDFWSWAIDKLSPGLRANTWYNKLQPYGLAGYLNDFSSRMVGFATIRQLRIQNSKYLFYYLWLQLFFRFRSRFFILALASGNLKKLSF